MSDDRKDVPSESAPNFQRRLRETMSVMLGYRGDKMNRAVILRDLVDSGIATLSERYLAGAGGNAVPPIYGPGPSIPGAYVPDLIAPPVPEGFAASTSKTSIQVVVDAPRYRQGHGNAKTRVYGALWDGVSALPVFANAALMDEFVGDVHAFPVDPAADYRLWVSFVSRDGVESAPAGGINGVTATAGLLDDANIAFLTASKIRAGAISVGEYIQDASYSAGFAGWRIDGNGYAEFSNVMVRGTVYANAGWIGGNTIDLTGLQSPGYIAGSAGWRIASNGTAAFNNIALRGQLTGGAYTGYGWPAAGTGGGFYIGPGGLLLGSVNDGKYFQVTASGDVYAPGLSVVAGSATFSGGGTFSGNLAGANGSFAGTLLAATGSFSGTLTASAVNAVNTINLAGQAVTIPIAAYTAGNLGTYGGVIVQALSIASTGAPITVTVSGSWSSASGVGMNFGVLRNGVTIYAGVSSGYGGPVAGIISDTPGPGTHTYQLFINGNAVGDGCRYRSMTLMETKR